MSTKIKACQHKFTEKKEKRKGLAGLLGFDKLEFWFTGVLVCWYFDVWISIFDIWIYFTKS